MTYSHHSPPSAMTPLERDSPKGPPPRNASWAFSAVMLYIWNVIATVLVTSGRCLCVSAHAWEWVSCFSADKIKRVGGFRRQACVVFHTSPYIVLISILYGTNVGVSRYLRDVGWRERYWKSTSKMKPQNVSACMWNCRLVHTAVKLATPALKWIAAELSYFHVPGNIVLERVSLRTNSTTLWRLLRFDISKTNRPSGLKLDNFFKCPTSALPVAKGGWGGHRSSFFVSVWFDLESSIDGNCCFMSW